MSALTFHKATGGSCEEAGCNRGARWTMLICGYPVPSQSPYAEKGRNSVICGAHRKSIEAEWEELSLEAPERHVEATVHQLRHGRGSARVFSLWALIEAGFGKAALRSFKGRAA